MINISMPKITKSLRITDINMAPGYGGVYFLYNQHRHLIYIGKSKCLRRRMFQHRYSSHFFAKVSFMKFFRADTELERELYETYAINKYKPFYNKAKVYRDTDVSENHAKYNEISEHLADVRDEIAELKTEDFSTTYGFLREEWPGDVDEYDLINTGEVLYRDGRMRELLQLRDRLKGRLNYLSFYAN